MKTLKNPTAVLPPAMPRDTARRFTTPWGERIAQAVDESSVWAALDAGDVLEAEAEALDALAYGLAWQGLI